MDILRLNTKSLKFFLLWPKDNMSWLSNIVIGLLYQTFILLSSMPTILAVGYQIAVGVDEINIIVESIIGVGDYFGYVFIYTCFLVNMSRIKRTIQGSSIFLKYCDLSVIKDAEEEVQFYTKGLMIYFSFGISINTILPLLDYKNCNERRLSDYYRKHDPCGMPTRVWLPFEVNTPIFVLIFLIHNNACVHICFTVLCSTMTLIGLLIHITAQIKNLRTNLLEVFNTPETESESEELVAEIEKKLNFCVKYHITIIKYTNEVFQAFNLMLIVHVFLTSGILAIIGYQIIAVDNFIDKLRYFLHMIGWVGMLFLTCFYGQLILNESTTIADAAYQSQWYNGPVRLRKIICLIILRSQKPLLLRVASIGVISLETFVSVMKTTYSYFALLLTIAE